MRGSYALLSHTILGRWGWGRTLVMFCCCSLHSTPSSDRCFSFRSSESCALESSLLRLPACHRSDRSWLVKQPRGGALPIGWAQRVVPQGPAHCVVQAGRLVQAGTGWLAGRAWLTAYFQQENGSVPCTVVRYSELYRYRSTRDLVKLPCSKLDSDRYGAQLSFSAVQ